MQVRKFRADSLQAALEEIRRTMGSGASVLQTRQVRDGWMGWLGRSFVEVTAGINEEGDTATVPIEHTASYRKVDARPVDENSTGSVTLSFQHALAPTFPSHLESFREALLAQGAAATAVNRWLDSTISFAADIGDRLEQPWLEHLQRAVAREIRFAGPIRTQPGNRQVVALVGPTGVGKTTTVAKLAAGFRLEEKRRVGLLTIDTYRIAAVEQLKAYAEIMDLPMEVVEQPQDMQSAMNKLGDVDLVLIDTAGRSPRSDARIEQLVDLLHAAQPDETHLVLSASSSAIVAQSVLDGFALARPTATILTKLDESPLIAGVISAITASDGFPGLPVSYLTNGQQVPDDIATADTEQIVTRLLSPPITMQQLDAA